jgi:beta-galactosidase
MAGATALPGSDGGGRGARNPLGSFMRISRTANLIARQGASAHDPENLALRAKANGSPGAVSEGSPYSGQSPEEIAAYANDGDLETLWGYRTAAPAGAWLALSWPTPVTFRQVLVRQNLDRDLTRLALQIRQQGEWRIIDVRGDGTVSLPKLILIEVPACTTDAIRLTGFKGVPSFYEVEVYEGPNPPVINVAGDAAGHIIGIISDAFGVAPKSGATVSISGRAGRRAWKAVLTSDEHGMFAVAAPTGVRGLIEIHAQIGTESIRNEIDAADIPLRLTPTSDLENPIDLNGTWKFATNPPEAFYRSDFDDAAGKTIETPSHWVMQGFPADGTGGYRRHVQIPTRWIGQRIKIRFEGIYSGSEVWLNGERVGSHEGGFTPFEVDVTEAAKVGANLLALRVTEATRSSSLDKMSFYADFPLAGIFRKAHVFPVPSVHIERFHVATLFDENFQNAVLKIDLRVVNEAEQPVRNAEVRWDLRAPDGSAFFAPFKNLRFDLQPWSHLEKTIEVPISKPLHWEAEHPQVYRLSASLHRNGEQIEQVSRRIGFRQVDVRGTEILINGRPVKFRGTCHHDSHPILGRAVTPEVTRKDLELIQEANLNALRTSHYPAVEELYDFADEMGVYVEAEAPFCWVNQSHDLRLTPLVIQHTAELLERDRSHPSVIWWSLCNESSWGPIFQRSHEYVKRSDPTRPVSAAGTRDLDLATRHNPITLERMGQVNSLNMPVVWDESLCIFQGIFDDGPELSRDPGERDYYIAPLIPIWDALLKSKVIQGSMIWAWSDDIFQVPERGSEFGRRQTRVHDVDLLYASPGKGVVGDAPWGVVDGWRRKKPEFWHTKKLQSPIKVKTLQVTTGSGNPIRLRVHNRYHFTNLAELTLAWRLGNEHGQLHPQVSPQEIAEIEIPAQQLTAGNDLEVEFLDSAGKLVDRERIRIETTLESKRAARAARPLEIRAEEKLLEGDLAVIRGGDFEIAFENDGSAIRRFNVQGRPLLYETPIPHILPIAPSDSEIPSPWTWQAVRPIAVTRESENILVTTSIRYLDVKGNLLYRVMPAGDLVLTYDLKYSGPDLHAREIGIRLGIPPWMSILYWERKGEWSAYPEDHIGRNLGQAQIHSSVARTVPPAGAFSQDDAPVGTNDFRSTKRYFTRAVLAGPDGYGLSILSDGRQHVRAIAKPDYIAVHVCDWFGGTASKAQEWYLNYGKGRLLKTGDLLSGTVHLKPVSKLRD